MRGDNLAHTELLSTAGANVGLRTCPQQVQNHQHLRERGKVASLRVLSMAMRHTESAVGETGVGAN